MAFRKAVTRKNSCRLLVGISFLLYPLTASARELIVKDSLSLFAPPVVRSARPLPSLTRRFQLFDGWTGADAAWSIPVSDKRTIWLFGDTWIGKIRKGEHIDATMINNTVGVQECRLKSAEQFPSIDFCWRTEANKGRKPSSFFASDEPYRWFWPGSGAPVEGSIFFVLHRIKKVEAREPEFGFAEDGDVLAAVLNPNENPLSWKIKLTVLPRFEGKVQFGNACFYENDYLYSLCTYRPARNGVSQHPAVLARLKRSDLLASNMDGWEFWCSSPDAKGNWQPLSLEGSGAKNTPTVLITDAAPEMSISKVSGLPGYIAVYIAAFEPYILMRHAPRPEGPWTDPVKIYKCPENRRKLFVYAAKAHPELAKSPGELVLTYCRNTKFFADQVKHSDWYAPQAVQVFLRQK